MATVTYVVVKGDSLWYIANKYLNAYGKPNGYNSVSSYVNYLANINNIANKNLIYVGQKLNLSGTASSSSTSSTAKKVTIEHFGLQADTDNKLFVTWKFSNPNTENYQVEWQYKAGSVWFIGSDSTVTAKQSTYDHPNNAEQVRVRIKPIAKKETKNNKEYYKFTGQWTDWKKTTYDVITNEPLDIPNVPTVNIEPYQTYETGYPTKVTRYRLKAETSNYTDSRATRIRFELIKIPSDGSASKKAYGSFQGLNGIDKHSTYALFNKLDDGYEYKVRCRAEIVKNGKVTKYSEPSDHSASVKVSSKTPTVFYINKSIETTDNTFDVYFGWESVYGATAYNIEYTENVDYFDTGGSTTTTPDLLGGGDSNVGIVEGLTGGKTYYFRIRSKNEQGESGWSNVISLTLGVAPAAPTTWSSVTSAVKGEEVTLYWMHNSADESEQKYAEIELIIDNGEPQYEVLETEAGKDPVNYYAIDTSKYADGGTLKWRVRTAGVLKDSDDNPKYGDYSIMRSVNVYEKPTVYVSVTDKDANDLEEINNFPFYASVVSSPDNQTPIMYHLSVVSNDTYETVDGAGNNRVIREGESIYSQHFDPSSWNKKHEFLSEFSAGNVDLENGISYTVACTVTMDSGLTGTGSVDFSVAWDEVYYEPDAEIVIDEDIYAAHIRPYCGKIPYYRVDYISESYVKTEDIISPRDGDAVMEDTSIVTTDAGETVYQAEDGSYFCIGEEPIYDNDVLLSVYRRDFDGTFVELATNIENDGSAYVTDPHPALNYARYRIVATSKTTGGVNYTDVSDVLIGGTAIVIQWDEDWSDYNIDNYNESSDSAWSGSMLILPYNIAVSNTYDKDVSLVNYIGHKHPVSYHGTHLGEKANWSTDIPKDDEVTLNMLRRLAIYTGNVYVREPSGSGYWASTKVSFDQSYDKLTIPVKIDITRVEGGV